MTSKSSLIRDGKIDNIRVISTFLVILAHMGMGELPQNVRTFDVVVLVFISGYSFMYHEHKVFAQYLTKRIKKLLVPTYLLLVVLFVCALIGTQIVKVSNPLTMPVIVSSFLFLDSGIGYIWVVKIYLLTAFSLYFLKPLFSKNRLYLIIGLFILIGIFGALFADNYGHNVILDSYIYNTIPYLLVAILGAIAHGSKKERNIIFITAVVIFLMTQFLWHSAFEPDAYKYPPQIYYISYGISVCGLLYFIIPNESNKLVTWLSSQSFTIYLIHILFLFGIQLVGSKHDSLIFNAWYCKYFIVLTCSIFCTFVLERIKTFCRNSLKDGSK